MTYRGMLERAAYLRNNFYTGVVFSVIYLVYGLMQGTNRNDLINYTHSKDVICISINLRFIICNYPECSRTYINDPDSINFT